MYMRNADLVSSVQVAYELLKNYSSQVMAIVFDIYKAGGIVLAIGGAVRDCFLGKSIKDLDCEVYGITLSELEVILKQHGPVRFVGKSFGVLRLDTLNVDWSLPRKDESGRKPVVTLNAHMQYTEACARRDLTINAIGINMVTGELIDPCNGLDDLRNGVLKSPDAHLFGADPLRFYRVMQFVSRFEMRVDDALNKVCADMDLSTVSRERIEQEWHKMLLLSRRPSLGIRWLDDINRLQDLFPELYALKNVPQRPDFHPEGDVFEHSMQALDAAVYQRALCKDEQEEKKIVYAALCHDLGKPSTTVWDKNRWRSPGHAQAGVAIARSFLRRITHATDLIKTVCVLVAHHMEPGDFNRNNASDGAYKKLAMKLYPHTSLRMLSLLYASDRAGRNGDGSSLPLTEIDPEVLQFQERVKQLGIYEKPEPALLTGTDLCDICKPGPHLGFLLRRIYTYQIKHGITNKERLKKYARTLCL
jgi:tRNA nucleotidyltransferase (CCA-adding enzyme)